MERRGLLSQIGRSASNRPGIRCTSSRTTRPSLARSSRSGVADSASRSAATSRSKTVDGPRRAVAPWFLAPIDPA